MHWQAQLLNNYVITQQAKEISMDKDLFQMRFCLTREDRTKIIAELQKCQLDHPCCSACDSKVEISWLRKLDDQPLHHAMCVPCFLRNNTDLDQDMIDRMVELGEKHGFYKDEPVAQPNMDAIKNFK
jgi:hypothetical protein